MTNPVHYSETKYHILLGIYVGAWGIVPGLTPKLIPLDLTWLSLGILSFSYGAFMHAITFPCTDAVAEIWGPKRARLMVYLGTGVYCVAMAFYIIGVNLPGAPGWPLNDAYNSVFAQAGRLVVASICATVVAQLLDVTLFDLIKKLTQGRRLWLRNNISTAISQFVDTCVFYGIAFYGVIPNDLLPLLILGTYIVKLSISVLDTPMVYVLVAWIKRSPSVDPNR
jgi:uncharacterized integral membrane protein (TIGR00697 family)